MFTQNSQFLPASVVIVMHHQYRILFTHGGMARLSWPGWMIKYHDNANVGLIQIREQ